MFELQLYLINLVIVLIVEKVNFDSQGKFEIHLRVIIIRFNGYSYFTSVCCISLVIGLLYFTL